MPQVRRVQSKLSGFCSATSTSSRYSGHTDSEAVVFESLRPLCNVRTSFSTATPTFLASFGYDPSKFVRLTCRHLTIFLDLTFSSEPCDTTDLLLGAKLTNAPESGVARISTGVPAACARIIIGPCGSHSHTSKGPHYPIPSTTALSVPTALFRDSRFYPHSETPCSQLEHCYCSLSPSRPSVRQALLPHSSLPRTTSPSLNPPGARSYPRIPS